MFSVFIDSVKQWSKTSDRHTKLQHIYIIAAFITLVAAGLISLLNYDIGRILIIAAATLIAVFLANAIVWALADSFIFSNLANRSTKR